MSALQLCYLHQRELHWIKIAMGNVNIWVSMLYPVGHMAWSGLSITLYEPPLPPPPPSCIYTLLISFSPTPSFFPPLAEEILILPFPPPHTPCSVSLIVNYCQLHPHLSIGCFYSNFLHFSHPLFAPCCVCHSALIFPSQCIATFCTSNLPSSEPCWFKYSLLIQHF